MTELFSRDQDEEEQELQVMRDEDEDDSAGSNHTLTLVPAIISMKSEIFCLAFSDDGRFLLACCGDGIVRVLNPHTKVVISVLVSKRERNGRVSYGKIEGGGGGGDAGNNSNKNKRASSILGAIELPCTCAAFRPHKKGGKKTGGVALLGYSHGEIQLWHVPSAKILHRQAVPPDKAERPSSSSSSSSSSGAQEERKKEAEPGNTTAARRRGSVMLHVGGDDEEDVGEVPIGVEVLCCAFSGDGELFAVGASDGVVRVYSDSTRELLVDLKPGIGRGAGHSSRVYSVKFHPDDSNVVVSGGWDKCVHVWDVEKAAVVQRIFGPHVCGDAVGVFGRTIVTGSWRDEAQLEAWDMDTGEASGPSFWSGHGKGALLQQGWGRRCRLYAAAFGGPEDSRGKFLAAGGGEGANEVFDFLNDKRLIGSLLGLSAGVISLAFGPEGGQLAVGLANGQVHLVDIETTVEESQESSGGKTIMVF
ncbi:unnamed protein product [Pylaiella littoralis]